MEEKSAKMDDIEVYTHKIEPSVAANPPDTEGVSLHVRKTLPVITVDTGIVLPSRMEGVFVYNSDTTQFKEELPDDVDQVDEEMEEGNQEMDEDYTDGEELVPRPLIIDESEMKQEIEETDESSDGENAESYVGDEVSYTKEELTDMLKTSESKTQTAQKKKKYKKQQSARNETRKAFIDFFKGLRPDFEKLTPERKAAFRETLNTIMKEQVNQE